MTEAACRLGKPQSQRPQRKSSASALVPIPRPGWAADLDLTFQQVPAGFAVLDNFKRSYTVGWGDQRFSVALSEPPGELHRDALASLVLPDSYRPVPMATAGFRLEHEAGVVLRAETRNRRFDVMPTPENLAPLIDASEKGRRSIRMGVVDDLLWIVEDAAVRAEPTNDEW